MERTFFPYHRKIGGEAALNAGGSHFQSHQGEHFYFHHRNFSSIEGQMFVVQVEGGEWLSDSCAYQDEPLYETREQALAAAAQRVIERVTRAAIDWGTMPVEQANAIAAWAAGIAAVPPPVPLEKVTSLPEGQLSLFGG